jgi:dTDP-4-amino-4,6-dideoxygalactose transaminase
MTSDLPALEGGTPVRQEMLAFARPEIGAEEEAGVIEVLRSGWLATGRRTAAFEGAFAALVGTRHAVATTSWTSAMHLLLRAFGIGAGDEVVTSALTFPATVNVILHAGARPVLVDVLPGRLTLDPGAVAAAITPRTRASRTSMA